MTQYPAGGGQPYEGDNSGERADPAAGYPQYGIEPQSGGGYPGGQPGWQQYPGGSPSAGQQGFPPSSGGPGYPPSSGGPVYPPQSGGPVYPPSSGPGYPPSSGGPVYPPTSGVPGGPEYQQYPQGPAFPPGQGGYPPPGGQYPPGQLPPNQYGLPPNQYGADPQYPPPIEPAKGGGGGGRKAGIVIGVLVVALLLCGGGGMAAWSALKSDDTKPAAVKASPPAKCVTATIGVLGPTSGEADDLGPATVNMANLAGSEYAAAHPGCKLNVRTFDSQGKSDKALPLAKSIIADKSIIGVIGPLYSKEATAVAPVLSKGGVPMVSSSASGVEVGKQGLKYFHRTVGTDANSGEAMAKYIKSGNPNAKVFIIDDGNDYAVHAADAAREALGTMVVGRAVVQQDQSTGFGSLAQQIISSGATTIAFGGFSQEAAGIRKAVDAAGGSKIGLVAGPGLLDTVYVTSTGSEGDSTIVVCACTPGAGLPQAFQDKLSAKSDTKPGVYVGEAYDAANAFVAAFTAGKNTREDVNNFLNTYSAQGVTGKISFEPGGDRRDEPQWYFVVGNEGFFGKSRIQ